MHLKFPSYFWKYDLSSDALVVAHVALRFLRYVAHLTLRIGPFPFNIIISELRMPIRRYNPHAVGELFTPYRRQITLGRIFA